MGALAAVAARPTVWQKKVIEAGAVVLSEHDHLQSMDALATRSRAIEGVAVSLPVTAASVAFFGCLQWYVARVVCVPCEKCAVGRWSRGVNRYVSEGQECIG